MIKMQVLKELFLYRELLKSNIKKEIRGKYKGSFLGILWSFVSPLLMVCVYAIVFPLILRVTQENYVIFLIVGILPWIFFTTVVNQGVTTVLNNAGIIKKVFFPREILPISIATSGLINFLISCIIIFIALFISGIGLSKFIIFLPIIILIQYILCLSIIFILSAINVYLRDIEYIINFLIMMLFYFTPVIYNLTLIPERFRPFFYLNPMVTIINSYRDILYHQVMPNLKHIGLVGLASLILLMLSYKIFKKLEKGFAEEV